MANKKKTVVVVNEKKAGSNLKPIKSTRSNSTKVQDSSSDALLFNREHYKWVLIGIGMIVLGMLLMLGGSMSSPDVWDDSLIYSARRTVIAPVLILGGLGMQIYAIFKK